LSCLIHWCSGASAYVAAWQMSYHFFS